MTIKERAEKWAKDRLEYEDNGWYWENILIEAYLAGNAQTQADYSKVDS